MATMNDIWTELRERKLNPVCTNVSNHHRFMPYQTALAIAQGNEIGEIDPSHKAILEEIGPYLEDYLDAIVSLTVDLGDSVQYGTGFVTEGDTIRVITNYHVLKDETGQLVPKEKVSVIFYHDSRNKPVVCKVKELTPMQCTDTVSDSDDADLDHLDYVILEVDERGESERGDFTVDVQRKFYMELSSRPQFLFTHINDKKNPDDKLVLMCIGHPHGAPKYLSFGELLTDTNQLWTDWTHPVDGNGKLVSVYHNCPTCPGSSGSPVFGWHIKVYGSYIVAKNMDSIAFPWFLHWNTIANAEGEVSAGGQAMSFQSIGKDIQQQFGL